MNRRDFLKKALWTAAALPVLAVDHRPKIPDPRSGKRKKPREMKKYINTDSVPGGNGTTTATTGPDRAYASLIEYEAEEQADLISAFDHTHQPPGGVDHNHDGGRGIHYKLDGFGPHDVICRNNRIYNCSWGKNISTIGKAGKGRTYTDVSGWDAMLPTDLIRADW